MSNEFDYRASGPSGLGTGSDEVDASLGPIDAGGSLGERREDIG